MSITFLLSFTIIVFIITFAIVFWLMFNMDSHKNEIINSNESIEVFRVKDNQNYSKKIYNYHEIIKNIKKQHTISLFKTFLKVFFLCSMLDSIIQDTKSLFTFLVVIIYFFYILIHRLTINEQMNERYGNPQNFIKILNEIDATKEIELDKIIISKRYITVRNDYESILACEDVLNIYWYHRRKFIHIIIKDIHGSVLSSAIPYEKLKYINSLMLFLEEKCKNARIGYSISNNKYVREMRREFKKNNNNSFNIYDNQPPI